MEAVDIGTVLLRFGHGVEHTRARIDHRGTGDANLRNQIGAGHITAGHSGDSGRRIDKARVPKQSTVWIVRIKRIDTVMFGGHEYYIVKLAGDWHIRYVEWLRINITVYRK